MSALAVEKIDNVSFAPKLPHKPLPAGPFTKVEKAQAFVEKMGIDFPVCGAVMDGPGTPPLAIAVSEAGGMGGMGLTWLSEAEVRAYVTLTKSSTSRPFAVGYVLEFEPKTLAAALESGAPVVQFSWGTPSQEQVRLVRSFGAKLGMQISNRLGAQQALDAGVDYICCQGQEAGGHVQAQTGWRSVLGGILDIAGETPVLVAGGIGDGKMLREVLEYGASGGIFGTRFVATKESPAHNGYKARLASATATDTSLTSCFDGGWSNALHRVIRNETLEAWEAAGALSAGKRPGEGEVIARRGDREFQRYLTPPPSADMTGQPMLMPLYSGTGVGSIHDIPHAGELVHRIWAECVGSAG